MVVHNCDESIRFAWISGDTLIKTKQGLITIKNLVNKKNFNIYTYNEKTKKEEIQKAEKCLKIKDDIVFEIETEDGKKIKATAEHEIITINGWKKLKDLKEGDDLINFKKIKSIKKIGIEPVFDIINVKNNNNYIANNFVVHNSSADWAKKENRELKKKLAQVRTKHLLYILCFPLKVAKVEKTYLESFTNYWCLTGDTKITTRDRNGVVRYTELKKLNKHNPELLTYNVKEKKYQFKKYDKKIKTKKDAEIFELELTNGLKIKATEDHLFLTQRGYISLKDLTENDEIEVKTKICKGCGKEFIPKKQSMIWCTANCKNKTIESKEKRHIYQVKYRKQNKNILKQKGKKRYLKNQDYNLKVAKEWREKNREKCRLYSVERRKKNPEYVRKMDKEWREKNLDYVLKKGRERFNRRYRNDITFRIKTILGNQLKAKLKTQYIRKKNKALEYLGCSIDFFKNYIEKKFKPGMSWENHSFYTWHLDHIKPCAAFDFTKESEIKKCFHYTNFQPLWWKDNLSKGSKYYGD